LTAENKTLRTVNKKLEQQNLDLHAKLNRTNSQSTVSSHESLRRSTPSRSTSSTSSSEDKQLNYLEKEILRLKRLVSEQEKALVSLTVMSQSPDFRRKSNVSKKETHTQTSSEVQVIQ
jgi:hypothetical protein